MQYRSLGRTGIRVSVLAFGAGPVPAVMTGQESGVQLAVVDSAVRAGINWFDTSATYGNGRSETSLGAALQELGVAEKVHVATKVRLMPDQLHDIGRHVRESFAGSLARLRLERITLLQLHNSITDRRGDEPTSLTPDDVLGPGGVLEAFKQLQADGLVDYLGITGIGQSRPLSEVIGSGQFDTMQTPFNILNPSAGQTMPEEFTETDYGNILSECDRQNMGTFAIRVFAGGALAGNPPSGHTLTTKFFPLDLYRRDQERTRRLCEKLPPDMDLKQAAVRFAASHPHITSTIIGFGDPSHIDEAVSHMECGGLSHELYEELIRTSLDLASDSTTPSTAEN
ncbi:MAG: aldo/keto reductase [Pirellulales bacterium]|nr:aldo/keto reductase [Pirellulales bacterium]